LFLIYNKNFSSCSRSWELQLYVNKEETYCEETHCELCGTCCCFIHFFNWKFETLFYCRGWDCS